MLKQVLQTVYITCGMKRTGYQIWTSNAVLQFDPASDNWYDMSGIEPLCDLSEDATRTIICILGRLVPPGEKLFVSVTST
jgi:hypothetical protein